MENKTDKKKVVVFTGAGISAESGVATFRDNGGLWDVYKVEDVATISGWRKNKSLVLEFYNKRRAEMKTVVPNDAHRIVAQLEDHFDVTVVTQNVDDLHERGGSKYVIHLHGQLNKVRSTLDKKLVYDWTEDLDIGHKCEKGSQLRPHIVWFGEALDTMCVAEALHAIKHADIFIMVGTSMLVEPAASMFKITREDCRMYYVNPDAPPRATSSDKLEVYMSELDMDHVKLENRTFKHVQDKATTGMAKVMQELLSV